eukprot:TRINITY_DN1273_c0_g1_i14.p2 TRINITY_DN1273_c0_g1~~TRINITY_DN1273_c0_g1_i14.p2  ORF type:complete len:100 (-),score=14.94 TRINITY_DN1273_c0_g1_i14:101-400(-)
MGSSATYTSSYKNTALIRTIPMTPSTRAAVYPKASMTVRKMQNPAADPPLLFKYEIRVHPSKHPARIMLNTSQRTHSTAWHILYQRIETFSGGLWQAPE